MLFNKNESQIQNIYRCSFVRYLYADFFYFIIRNFKNVFLTGSQGE